MSDSSISQAQAFKSGPMLKRWIKANYTKWSASNLKTILPLVNAGFRKFYKNMNTLDKAFTETRQLFKDAPDKYKVARSEIFGWTPAEKETMLARAEARKVKTNEDKVAISSDRIIQIIKKARTGDAYDKLVASGLALGSRKVELLTVGNYSIDGDKVLQEGLAKNKGDKNESSISKKPIGMTPAEFIETLTSARTALSDKLEGSRERVGDRHTRKLTKAVLKWLPEAKSRHDKMHFLRKIYAGVSYDIHGKRTKLTKPRWIQLMLGHGSMDTSLSYNGVEAHSDEPDLPEIRPEPPSTPLPTPMSAKTKTKTQKFQHITNALQGKKITVRAIKALGYGTRIASEYRKAHS